MRNYIDLNCDMGESFGIYQLGADEEIIQFISSANVACGLHAGDPNVIDHTVEIAKKHGVSIGAHPGYSDLIGFGRRFIDLEPKELINLVIYQVGALDAFCKKHGVELRHIKPHGALGNLSDSDESIANSIADAILLLDPNLPIFVKPSSQMHKVAVAKNLRFVLEIYADRAYNNDLSLVSRKEKGALITDPDFAAERVRKMVTEGRVTSIHGQELNIHGDTICVHGDTPSAVIMLKKIREILEKEGVIVRPFYMKDGVTT